MDRILCSHNMSFQVLLQCEVDEVVALVLAGTLGEFLLLFFLLNHLDHLYVAFLVKLRLFAYLDM